MTLVIKFFINNNNNKNNIEKIICPSLPKKQEERPSLFKEKTIPSDVQKALKNTLIIGMTTIVN